jgi:DNA-binding NarL/FixJ family response regulator
MKLKYKILWFEDSDSAYGTLKNYVEDYLKGHEFVPEIYRFSNDDDGINTILAKADFDLILMDFNLDGVRGDEVIENIRNQELLTEVVFYSSTSTREIRKSIADKGIDGVYCTSREIVEFEEKVIKVINNTIKKVQDVNNMRGLVIAEVIDLEIKIKEMLQQFFVITSGDKYNLKQQKVYSGVGDKKLKSNQEEMEFINTIDGLKFQDLLDRNYFLTSMNLFHALQDTLKQDISEMNTIINGGKIDSDAKHHLESKRTALQNMKLELNSFEVEIIKLRNILAHAKEKFTKEGIPYLESLGKNDEKTEFTNEKYIEIRKSIKKHSDNLHNIVQFFKIQQQVNDEAAAAKK